MLMTANLKSSIKKPVVEDPLEHDKVGDPVVTTTRRAISRVAYVAAETASRFEREGIAVDPMAWMMTPRDLFGGKAGIDACLDRLPFTRAVLLHGLSLGMDASPEAVDDIANDDDLDDDGDYADAEFLEENFPDDEAFGGALMAGSSPSASSRLFSATMDVQRDGCIRHGFHASMATSIDEFRARVGSIFGSEALIGTVCREGLNPGVPLIGRLVSNDLIESLLAADAGAGSYNLAVTTERVVQLDG